MRSGMVMHDFISQYQIGNLQSFQDDERRLILHDGVAPATSHFHDTVAHKHGQQKKTYLFSFR